MKEFGNKLENFMKWDIDKVFVGLVFFLFVIDLPFFLDIVVPLHDTKSSFLSFYFFYNEFYHHGEIARWLPFGYYGIHSDYLFVHLLTPIQYLVGLAGWIARAEDTLLLFKVSTFIEQLVLLFGTYLLSVTFFKRRVVAALVCLAVIGSTAHMNQILWNFRLFYLLPLIIYFLVRFFTAFKPQHLIITMIIFTFSTDGSLAYSASVNLLVIATASLVLFLGNHRNWHNICVLTKKDIVLSALLLLVGVVYTGSFYYFAKGSLDLTETLSPGRDPITGITDLRTFLTYGGDIGKQKFADLLTPEARLYRFHNVSNAAYDVSLYIGLIPLVFVLYGISRFRDSVYLSLVALVLVLGLFSMGGRFAEFLYQYFPTMKYYRHIGFAVSGYKVLLPLLAGYGFKLALERLETEDEAVNERRALFARVFFAAVLGISALAHAKALRAAGVHINDYVLVAVVYVAGVAGLLRVLFYVKKYLNARRHFMLFLVVCMCVEIISYQGELTKAFKQHAESMTPVNDVAVRVKDYGFQNERMLIPPPGRVSVAMPFAVYSTPYVYAYNFLQWDPCLSEFRTDTMNSFAAKLIRLKGGAFQFVGEVVHPLDDPDDPDLRNALGCEAPKLKLFSKAVYSDSEEETQDILTSGWCFDEAVVLNNVPLAERLENPVLERGDGTVRVVDFRANRLDLEVETPAEGIWLYYADSWHPFWKARVNGKESDIARANLAFKAVRLEKGLNRVSFYVDGGRKTVYLTVIVVVGLLVALLLVAAIVVTIFRPRWICKDLR
jgi:hypothetical protein